MKFLIFRHLIEAQVATQIQVRAERQCGIKRFPRTTANGEFMTLFQKGRVRRSTLNLLTALLTLLALPSSHAAFISAEVDGPTAYFLYSAPNKIERFDLNEGTRLESIALNAVPTAMVVHENTAFIAHHREVRAVDLMTQEDRFLRNFSSTVEHMSVLGDKLYIKESGTQELAVVDAVHGELLQSSGWVYGIAGMVASPVNNALYFRDAGLSPSDINRVALDESGLIASVDGSPYHGDYPAASQLYLNGSENKIYDGAGIVYYADGLTYAGSLGGAVEALAFIEDNAVFVRDHTAFLVDDSLREVGTASLEASTDFLATNESTAFSFSFSSSDFLWQALDLSAFELPQAGEPINPEGLNYQPEFIETAGTEGLYLVDVDTLSVFGYSLTEKEYVSSWRLQNPPTWVSFSESHQRLYLGYQGGKITYFDVQSEDPTEVHFTSLANGMAGLLAVGDYLFAADRSGAWNTHYLFSYEGAIASSVDWRNVGRKTIPMEPFLKSYLPSPRWHIAQRHRVDRIRA